MALLVSAVRPSRFGLDSGAEACSFRVDELRLGSGVATEVSETESISVDRDTDRGRGVDCVAMTKTIVATANSTTSVAAVLALFLVRSGAII